MKHEYLEEEDYYESNKINKGRTVKRCEHCGKDISIGIKHENHTFMCIGEYPVYPTHLECSELFIKSLN